MSNRDPFNQMWAEALAMLERADQMQRQFFQLRASAQSHVHPAWEPPADILETSREIQIIVALPGVTAQNVSITLTDHELVIAAARAWPGRQSDAAIRRVEIPHGHFERRIQVPPGVRLRGSRLIDGCLFLTLDKL
jgi:HSP20 family protein